VEQPIPLADGLASGLQELSGAQPLLVNFLIDQNGAMSMRPCIRTWADYPVVSPTNSPVIGIFPWQAGNGRYVIFVTQDRKIWAWLGTGLVQALSDSTSPTQLDGSLRPIFAYDQERVVITGGGAPQKWEGTGLSARLAPGQTMPDGSALAFTHIAYNAQRLIGNNYNNSGIFQWTDPGVGNHGVWPIVGAYFQEAEAWPDPLVALFSNANEVFTFGTETTQVFLPDPTTAFAAAMTVQVGCGAPYSIIPIGDVGAFAWLDERHRFGFSDGRSFQSLSTPQIDADVTAPGFVVSDCWGARIKIGSWDLLLWVFPTQGRGFCYDRNTNKWVGEFRSIDGNGNWLAWTPLCYAFVPGSTPQQNIHLVGLANGTIAELTFAATDDLGTKVKAVARTGFQNRGTFNRKVCSVVRTQFVRGGTAQPGPAPIVELRYRDDLGAFKPVIQWSAGIAGDYQPVVEKRNAGIYRQREWELEWSGGGPFVLTGATETFDMEDT
jgi:hypothetical protein